MPHSWFINIVLCSTIQFNQEGEVLPLPGGTELPCLQLFLLKEDLSIHGVRAGGCGVRAAGDWWLLPWSD